MDDDEAYNIIHNMKYNIVNKNIEEKYDLIIKFINVFSPEKIESLRKFKKVDICSLKIEKIKEALDKYKYKLEGELSIEIDDENIDIAKIIVDCLDSIDYSIIRSEYDDKIYVTIVDVPRKKNNNIRPKTPDEFKKIQNDISEIYKAKKKIFLKFLNSVLKTKFKSVNKVKFNVKDIVQKQFETTLFEYQDSLETILCVKFNIDINNEIKINKILEKCLFSFGYMIKKEKLNEDITITFIEQ
jgi:hypothetical protein